MLKKEFDVHVLKMIDIFVAICIHRYIIWELGMLNTVGPHIRLIFGSKKYLLSENTKIA